MNIAEAKANIGREVNYVDPDGEVMWKEFELSEAMHEAHKAMIEAVEKDNAIPQNLYTLLVRSYSN